MNNGVSICRNFYIYYSSNGCSGLSNHNHALFVHYDITKNNLNSYVQGIGHKEIMQSYVYND